MVEELFLGKYINILGVKPLGMEWSIFLNEISYLNAWYYIGVNMLIRNKIRYKKCNEYENNSKLLKYFSQFFCSQNVDYYASWFT